MIDEARTREFGRELIGTFSGAVMTFLIGAGHATGRFEAAAGAQTRRTDVLLLLDLGAVTAMARLGLRSSSPRTRTSQPAQAGSGIVCPNGPARLLFEVAGVQGRASAVLLRTTTADAPRVARAV